MARLALQTGLENLQAIDPVVRTGQVTRILSTYLEADGPATGLGALCTIEAPRRTLGDTAGPPIVAEVVGIHPSHITLAPLDTAASVRPGARVTVTTNNDSVPVGDAFLGRAVDPLGRPIDTLGPIVGSVLAPRRARAPSPLARVTPREPIETGIRAIDSLLTVGHGQRIGVFAAAGVGKTTLMTQLARQVRADRCVICLVGERGREIDALWTEALAQEHRAKAVLVAATSDQSAALRVRAGDYALALAEHWRAQGLDVLLLLDSVTRLAMAMREIGLAAGEPPTIRAYTPGVFAAIPKLVERCGALRTGGSITAVMTVLSETDDVDDPISELMKSLLDGHIILSRALAEQGHHPAIDIPRSVSRLAGRLLPDECRATAVRASALLSTYETARTLIEAGVYVPGASAEIDRAIARRPALVDFLRQPVEVHVPTAAGRSALATAVGDV